MLDLFFRKPTKLAAGYRTWPVWAWFLGFGISAVCWSSETSAQPTPQPTSAPVMRQTPQPTSAPVVRQTPQPTSVSVARQTPQPASVPVVRQTPQPASVPVVRQTPQPASVPSAATRIAVQPQKTRLQPSLPPYRQPFLSGWLSFTLSAQDQIWLDGQPVGTGIVPYLRVQPGSHAVKIHHARWGTTELAVVVRADQHTIVLRGRKRVGLRFSPGEHSNVSVRHYRPNRQAQEEIRVPGPYCVAPKTCPILMPGDQLYVQSDGRYVIVSPMQAVRNAQSYRVQAGDGFLTFYSYPPGALFLNKRMVGVAPVAQLPLRPGKYDVLVRNGFLQMEWEGQVVIQASQEVRKVVYTTPPRGGNVVVLSEVPSRIYFNGLYKGWTPAHVLPVSPGQHTLRLQRPDGSTKTYPLEIHPGQLEIVQW